MTLIYLYIVPSNTVPSTDDRKQLEKDRIIQELKLNDYPEKFISDTCRPRNKPPHNDSEMTRGVTCIPYIKGISEQIKRTLSNVGVRTAYKSTESLGDIFLANQRTNETFLKQKVLSTNFSVRIARSQMWARVSGTGSPVGLNISQVSDQGSNHR